MYQFAKHICLVLVRSCVLLSQICVTDYVTVQSISLCKVAADLCSSFLDHFQLTLVDLNTPEETIKEPQEDPPCQPEKNYK